MKSVWNEVKQNIKQQVPAHIFTMWIDTLELEKIENNEIMLSTPNFFSKKRVLDHYGALIESIISRITDNKVNKLTVQVAEGASPRRETSRLVSTASNLDLQIPLPIMNVKARNGRLLRKDFTFDNFVVSGNNNFAYSAAMSLASQRQNCQNSLFLLSQTGMGKSHLAQAVGHHILSQQPNERVFYITLEDFTNEMVQSFRNDTISDFKEKYRRHCDVLLLEDVQFLTGKERTQIELALILDYLFDAEKKIIFSSCYLPGDIPKMIDPLRSRLSSSLISRIEPPDFKTRMKILCQKSRENGYGLPGEILEYLASELSDDVRQLESGLKSIVTKASLMNTVIDLDLARSVVDNIAVNRKQITIDVIKKLVSKEYGVSLEELVSRSRKQCFVRPRQVAIYLARKYTDQPLQVIGKGFNRYHATALHSINVVERNVKQDNSVRDQVKFLSEKLENGRF
ncbi:MAG: chromosomal replication initiator protein DnaA [Desulfobacterales bacterium]|nr:chromosomal replication initiator protein DnaA [Desulfobacterales bacterium]MDD4071215.1 chromosomal replication initiator protein DnaA [Desulfobacterales bacterium]MDD4392223.1 chromosomal replication initiator protein DnaA [Desulfobacterales bacterium]